MQQAWIIFRWSPWSIHFPSPRSNRMFFFSLWTRTRGHGKCLPRYRKWQQQWERKRDIHRGIMRKSSNGFTHCKRVSRSVSRYVFMFSHDPVSRLPPKLSRTERRRRRRRNCARFSYAQVAYTVVFRNPGKCVTRRCERESGKRNRVVIRDTRSRAKDSAQVHLSQYFSSSSPE